MTRTQFHTARKQATAVERWNALVEGKAFKTLTREPQKIDIGTSAHRHWGKISRQNHYLELGEDNLQGMKGGGCS